MSNKKSRATKKKQKQIEEEEEAEESTGVYFQKTSCYNPAL